MSSPTSALTTGLGSERSIISGPGWEPTRLSHRRLRTGPTTSPTTRGTTRTAWRSTSRVTRPPANGTTSPAPSASGPCATPVRPPLSARHCPWKVCLSWSRDVTTWVGNTGPQRECRIPGIPECLREYKIKIREKHLFEARRDFGMAQPTLLIIDDTVLRKCYFLRARRLSKNFYKTEKSLENHWQSVAISFLVTKVNITNWYAFPKPG